MRILDEDIQRRAVKFVVEDKLSLRVVGRRFVLAKLWLGAGRASTGAQDLLRHARSVIRAAPELSGMKVFFSL